MMGRCSMITDNHWRGEKTIEIYINLVIDWTRICEELKKDDIPKLNT